MTPAELAKYYANLLIKQYQQKPKAFATIEAVTTPVFMDLVPAQVQNAYDIDTAIGVQLDVIGKYVGAFRTNTTTTGPVILDDDDFRKLIKLLILKNNSGSSLATIQSLLTMNFPETILISDTTTMQLNYVLVQTLGSNDLLRVLTSNDYLPRPMGVQTSITIVPSHTNPFFGFRTYAAPDPTVSPFNTYSFYQLTYPWLTYSEV